MKQKICIKALVLIAALSFSGCPTSVGQPSDWPFAVADPTIALSYRYDARRPPECNDPNVLLAEIEREIRESPEPRCATNIQAAGNSHVLNIRCNLPSSTGGCTLAYTGYLWSEREPMSTTDYDLRGVGWLTSTCRSGRTYQIDAKVRAQVQSRGGRGISKIVDRCRENLSP
jgi:hypothetical protein